MNKFHIITPFTRVQNIVALIHSVDEFYKQAKFRIQWNVVFDRNTIMLQDVLSSIFNSYTKKLFNLNWEIKTYIYEGEENTGGFNSRNYVLKHLVVIPENLNDYVFFLDDDTVLHEKLVKFVNGIKKYEEYDIIVGHQEIFPGQRRLTASKENMKVGHVDTGSFICKLDIFNNYLFNNSYCADGEFIEKMMEEKKTFLYLNQNISYYNLLKNIIFYEIS